MATAKVDKVVKVVLELTEEEATGLHYLLNYGTAYDTLEDLKVMSIFRALSDISISRRGGPFEQKAVVAK